MTNNDLALLGYDRLIDALTEVLDALTQAYSPQTEREEPQNIRNQQEVEVYNQVA